MSKNYKINFKKSDLLKNNNSQSGQDIFVLSCLDGKENGTYLDLGSNDAININNTYILETAYGWTGISIDIDPIHEPSYKERKTPFLLQDCTTLDFNTLRGYYDGKHIDYLSLDLEPASVTLKCLENIPLDSLEFSIITYEHDSYRFGSVYRDASRNIFDSFGYIRICSDVNSNGCAYEDWYYNPKYVDPKKIEKFSSEGQDWSTILYN